MVHPNICALSVRVLRDTGWPGEPERARRSLLSSNAGVNIELAARERNIHVRRQKRI